MELVRAVIYDLLQFQIILNKFCLHFHTDLRMGIRKLQYQISAHIFQTGRLRSLHWKLYKYFSTSRNRRVYPPSPSPSPYVSVSLFLSLPPLALKSPQISHPESLVLVPLPPPPPPPPPFLPCILASHSNCAYFYYGTSGILQWNLDLNCAYFYTTPYGTSGTLQWNLDLNCAYFYTTPYGTSGTLQWNLDLNCAYFYTTPYGTSGTLQWNLDLNCAYFYTTPYGTSGTLQWNLDLNCAYFYMVLVVYCSGTWTLTVHTSIPHHMVLVVHCSGTWTLRSPELASTQPPDKVPNINNYSATYSPVPRVTIIEGFYCII